MSGSALFPLFLLLVFYVDSLRTRLKKLEAKVEEGEFAYARGIKDGVAAAKHAQALAGDAE